MIDFSKIKTYPIAKRGNKSETTNFSSIDGLSESIPDILAGKEFKEMIELVSQAVRNKKTIILMIGGHVIKCGLSPLIIDLMRRGVITHLAFNGAASIHDFEIAMQGATSEDVVKGLADGSFGMVEETGAQMNAAINNAHKSGRGQGEAFGDATKKLRNANVSIMAVARELRIPLTVHVAIGTDIIHQHPTCDGAALGATTFTDFKHLAETISTLENGVVLNFGSAVIMPETFLKALTIARNLGSKVKEFTAVNFDMLPQYRPLMNVVSRPTLQGGRGFSFIGQHELLIPLFYTLLIKQIGEEK